MNLEKIKEIALANGFSLKEQASGNLDLHSYVYEFANAIEQAAKAQLIDERDHFESQAEQLKDKLQDLYGVDFGEHSNCNCPFQNAIDFDDSTLVLVPKEPTEKMLKAIYDNKNSTANAYKAMIKAREQSNEL